MEVRHDDAVSALLGWVVYNALQLRRPTWVFHVKQPGYREMLAIYYCALAGMLLAPTLPGNRRPLICTLVV
jgi:hypothetical protein